MEIKSIQGNKGTLFKVNNKLSVNFSSLVYYGELFRNFIIQHYIAFDIKKFGYFYKDSEGNTKYYYTTSDKVEIKAIPYTLDVSHFVKEDIRPTAGLIYPDSKFIVNNNNTYKIIMINNEN